MNEFTEEQKQEAKALIDDFFGHLNEEKQNELYESILDQDYEEWEDWCINMSFDYDATDMMKDNGF